MPVQGGSVPAAPPLSTARRAARAIAPTGVPSSSDRIQGCAPNVNAETIQSLIEQGLPGARADVRGDDGVHFEATVVAEAFRGKLPLARHRLVYATLGERMGGEIHALALKTLTPDEAAAA